MELLPREHSLLLANLLDYYVAQCEEVIKTIIEMNYPDKRTALDLIDKYNALIRKYKRYAKKLRILGEECISNVTF